jgi:hypothetical protein
VIYYAALFEPLSLPVDLPSLSEFYSGVLDMEGLNAFATRGAEIRSVFGYSRQLVSITPPAGNTAAITFGPIADPPAFAAPSDHPNSVIAYYVGLCTGGVVGVEDVVAFARLPEFGSDSQPLAGHSQWGEALMRGESLVFAAGSLTIAGTVLTVGDVHVTPARGTGNFETPPSLTVLGQAVSTFNLCALARFYRYVHEYQLWLQSVGFATQATVDSASAVATAYATAALGAGCTL